MEAPSHENKNANKLTHITYKISQNSEIKSNKNSQAKKVKINFFQIFFFIYLNQFNNEVKCYFISQLT